MFGQRVSGLSRSGGVSLTSKSADEWVFHVDQPGRPISATVRLWPAEVDWVCDCDDENDPCPHVAAAAIATRHDTLKSVDSAKPAIGHIEYELQACRGYLALARNIVVGASSSPLTGSLTRGRSDVTVSAADMQIELLLGRLGQKEINRGFMRRLVEPLSQATKVRFDGREVQVEPHPSRLGLVLRDRGPGVWVDWVSREEGLFFPDSSVQVIGGKVVLVDKSDLPADLAEWIGHDIGPKSFAFFAAEVLPRIKQAAPVEVKTSRIPETIRVEPRLEVETRRLSQQEISLSSSVVYGSPPIARLVGNDLEYLDDRVVPVRDRNLEASLIAKVRRHYSVVPGAAARLPVQKALDLASQMARDSEVKGLESLSVGGRLAPMVVFQDGKGEISFEGPSGVSIGVSEVLGAWRQGASVLFSEGLGQYLDLPTDWLAQVGPLVERLLTMGGAGKLSRDPVRLHRRLWLRVGPRCLRKRAGPFLRR